jgi:chitodextrinase
MRYSEAIKRRRLIETAADNGLTDEEALEGVELFPAWDPAGQYQTGQRVRYEGNLYRCLQAHQAQEGWTPTAAPSLWARVLIEDPNTVPEWVQPDSTNTYAKGDRVSHNGKVWVSLYDNNSWEPGVFGWEPVD